MNGIFTIFQREFLGYFRTPIAYIFIASFVVFSIGIPWFLFDFYDEGNADLTIFFSILPWIFLFLIPAVGMRLWAEEKKSGTLELLFTLPVTATQAVLAKFLAGWLFIILGLVLTMSLPLTLAFLGDPDWGPIIAGYLGSAMLGGAYLGVCSLTSACTKNQVISFILSVLLLLALLALGLDAFSDLISFLPVQLVDAISNFSFLTHSETIKQGLIRFENIIFFLTVIIFTLSLTVIKLEK